LPQKLPVTPHFHATTEGLSPNIQGIPSRTETVAGPVQMEDRATQKLRQDLQDKQDGLSNLGHHQTDRLSF